MDTENTLNDKQLKTLLYIFDKRLNKAIVKLNGCKNKDENIIEALKQIVNVKDTIDFYMNA